MFVSSMWVWNVSGWWANMLAWTSFICSGPSCAHFQLGKLVETGVESCNSLILLGVFTSVDKTTVISAFMGRCWCRTAFCLWHWFLQCVKWRTMEWHVHAETRPHLPFLSVLISLVSETCPLQSLTSPHSAQNINWSVPLQILQSFCYILKIWQWWFTLKSMWLIVDSQKGVSRISHVCFGFLIACVYLNAK